MIALLLRERIALAESLHAPKQAVAAAVTDEFFRRHPDWLARCGERGRKLGIEDALFHIDFLAGSCDMAGLHKMALTPDPVSGPLRYNGFAMVS